jgi:hypothetical protein
MKRVLKKIAILGLILLTTQNCTKKKSIQSIDTYVETIFRALKKNKFSEIKPLLLDVNDSSFFNNDIYRQGILVRDDIRSFMFSKEANKKYNFLTEKRFESLKLEFVKLNVNMDSISFDIKKLHSQFKTNNGEFRSSCDVVFNSCGKRFILVLTDILYVNNSFKNFNFQQLDTYENELRNRHKNLMAIIPFTAISIEEWNVNASSKDYSSPVKLKDFVFIINNQTHWNFEGFRIKITLFDKRDNGQNPIYNIIVARHTPLNNGERIQVKVPEFDDFIISKSLAVGKSLDAKFEIIDLQWKDEFDLMN